MSVPPDEIAAFRNRVHFEIVERLTLQTALVVRASILGLSMQESRDRLKDWLEHNSVLADQVFGVHFGDPAQSALYADEVREIVDNLKAKVDKMAGDAENLLGNRT